jgi:hypothetical protein
MEKSRLETAPNKLLYALCVKILKKCKGAWNEIYDFESTYDDYESVLKKIGYSESVDVDFIFNVIRLNISELENSESEVILIRPELSLYDIKVEIKEDVYQIQTWKVKMESYADNNGIASNKYVYEEQTGTISAYDGELINTEVLDAETRDSNVVGIRRID